MHEGRRGTCACRRDGCHPATARPRVRALVEDSLVRRRGYVPGGQPCLLLLRYKADHIHQARGGEAAAQVGGSDVVGVPVLLLILGTFFFDQGTSELILTPIKQKL